MVYHITPSLGIDLNYHGPLPYYDGNFTVPSPALGTVVKATDGHDYIWAKAGAALADAGTDVDVADDGTFVATEPGSGTGAFVTLADGIANGDYLWLKKSAF